MRADPVAAPPATDTLPPSGSPRARRGPGGHLERALLALAGGHGRVIEHRERSWASITFAGTRHTVRMVFDTPEAIDGGEALIADLPEHEFSLPGRLVADATIREVDHAMDSPEGLGPRLAVTCELLLLEDV